MAITPTRRIALFGATGRTGGSTVRSFMKHRDFQNLSIELRLVVRSKEKLFRLIPELADSENVRTWEGQLTDLSTIQKSLQNVDTIIMALGENDNISGCHVLQDLSTSIVQSLDDLRKHCTGTWKKPRLILLSSSTWNDRFAANEPAVVNWILKKAFYHPYLDLRLATSQLESASDLLSLLLVQPSALIEDEPFGVEISTEFAGMAITYPDLGEAFVQLATEPSYGQLGAVGAFSKIDDPFRRYGLFIMSTVLRGLVSGYVPGYWTIKKWLS